MASSKYGRRWVCFSCGCKFYDLKKQVPLCPKCGSDQSKAPKKDTRFTAPPVPEDYDVPDEAEGSEDVDFQEDEEIVSEEPAEEFSEDEEE